MKTKIVTTDFPAGHWVTVPRPEGARSILSLKIVSRSATNGYYLIWADTAGGIQTLRLNTSGSNVYIIDAASTNVQIEIAYI